MLFFFVPGYRIRVRGLVDFFSGEKGLFYLQKKSAIRKD